MNCRGKSWLEFRPNRFRFAQRLMEIFRFSVNLVGIVGGDSTRFSLYLHNKGPYGQTDKAIGFSTSHRPLEGHSDCLWMEIQKSRNETRFSPYLHNQGPYVQTDNAIGFSASNRSIHPLEGHSDCRQRGLWMEISKL